MSNLIDVVYLWCDGNDPVFINKKQKLMSQLDLKWDESNCRDLRYVDNQELRFSLRSVSKYLPWVNHIYVVTNEQRPTWLVEHPRITIVDHQEIIPKHYLPTFNSVAIESFIHNIQGLEEKFLLFNDDMFINAPLQPSFFFTEDGAPKVRLIKDKNKWQFKSFEEAEKALISSEVASFRKTLINAWYLFSKRHGISPFYILSHTVDSYTKETFRFVQSQYPELLQRNHSPFRLDSNIQRVLYQLEMVSSLNCPLIEIKGLTFLQKHIPFLTYKAVDSYEGTESPKIWKRIRTLRPKMFCLNAATSSDLSIKRESLRLMRELFPEPSPFEKSE